MGQPPSRLRPHNSAEKEEPHLCKGNVGIVQQSPCGELKTAVATVPQGTGHNGVCFTDEVQITRHGLHGHGAVHTFIPVMCVHCAYRYSTCTGTKKKQMMGKNTSLTIQCVL